MGGSRKKGRILALSIIAVVLALGNAVGASSGDHTVAGVTVTADGALLASMLRAAVTSREWPLPPFPAPDDGAAGGDAGVISVNHQFGSVRLEDARVRFDPEGTEIAVQVSHSKSKSETSLRVRVPRWRVRVTTSAHSVVSETLGVSCEGGDLDLVASGSVRGSFKVAVGAAGSMSVGAKGAHVDFAVDACSCRGISGATDLAATFGNPGAALARALASWADSRVSGWSNSVAELLASVRAGAGDAGAERSVLGIASAVVQAGIPAVSVASERASGRGRPITRIVADVPVLVSAPADVEDDARVWVHENDVRGALHNAIDAVARMVRGGPRGGDSSPVVNGTGAVVLPLRLVGAVAGAALSRVGVNVGVYRDASVSARVAVVPAHAAAEGAAAGIPSDDDGGPWVGDEWRRPPSAHNWGVIPACANNDTVAVYLNARINATVYEPVRHESDTAWTALPPVLMLAHGYLGVTFNDDGILEFTPGRPFSFDVVDADGVKVPDSGYGESDKVALSFVDQVWDGMEARIPFPFDQERARDAFVFRCDKDTDSLVFQVGKQK